MRSHFSHSVISRLMLGTAVATLTVPAVFAQNESITITGTSIRGQAPVGANVITVDRAAIESTGAQTTQQLLSTIPQLSDFGSAAQGNLNTGGRNNSGPDGAGNQTPTIHSLGSSTSSSTLILIDGHRLPNTGLTHNLLDASIIPPNAISSVEVLPDGASAIYGSDAVAGVINFHTRKDYNGWETTIQGGYAEGYESFGFGQVFGHSWEDGGVTAAYSYSSRSNLMNRDRDHITARQDLRLGAVNPAELLNSPYPDASLYPNLQSGQPLFSRGSNFQNFTSCPTAVIATSSNSNVPGYVFPYAAGNIVQRQATPAGTSSGGPGVGICDVIDAASVIPSELRNQGIVAIRQAINERLMASMDVLYSSRLGSARSSRGGATNVTMFRTGGTGGPAHGTSQINPFYVGVPGATQNTSFVSLSLDELLADQGLGFASTKTGQITALATGNLDYDLGGDWLLSLGGTVGQDYSFQRTQGSVNGAQVNLALNGTTLTSGARVSTPASSVIADPYGLGTVVSVTRALTTANALDVWNPAGPTNRTSASVLRSLVDSKQSRDSIQSMQTARLKVDGPVFDPFGAGNIKTALGAEYIHYTWNERPTETGNAGPASTSSEHSQFNYNRSIYAAFAEFVIPVINADMEIPLVQYLIFDFAGRYDQYSDFGNTKNPKLSFEWGIIDGIRTSAAMGASFTAPPLSAIGVGSSGLSGASGVNNGGAQNNLIVAFNDTRPFNDGAGIAGTFVSNAPACFAAGSTPVDAGGLNAAAGGGTFPTATGCKIVSANSTGLTVSGANANLKPQIGQTYSVNLLVDFGKLVDWFQGLDMQVTYYQARINGLITNVNIQTSATNPGLPFLTVFGPANGCGPATIATCGAGLANQPGWAPSDPVIQALVTGRPLSNPLPQRVYSLGSSQVQNALNLWQNGLDFAVNYRISTESWGDFTFNINGNQILRFTQQNAGGTAPFDIKNGKNGGRFVGQEFSGSISVNWRMDPFTFGVRFNHQAAWNDAMTQFPYNLPGPNRLANTYHIPAFDTIGLNFSYNLPEDWMSGSQVSVNVQDLLNTFGTRQNSATALATGSQLGRQITLSLRKKW